MRKTIAFSAALSLTLALLTARDPAPTEVDGNTPSLPDMRSEIAFIKLLFGSAGTDTALKELTARYASYDNPTVHALEHFIGGELYFREGAAGAARCPYSPNAGCFHGFFIEAYRHKGLSFAEETVKSCTQQMQKAARLRCAHGIGHGLLVVYNSDKERVQDALLLCAAYNKTSIERDMCASGVFMEYHNPSRHGQIDVSTTVKKLKHDNQFSLCPDIQDESRRICYFELPLWWYLNFAGDENRFRKIGTMCDQITDHSLKALCFMRIGTMLAVEPDVSEVVLHKECDASAQANKLDCLKGIAWSEAVDGHPAPIYLCASAYQHEHEQNTCENELINAYEEIANAIQ